MVKIGFELLWNCCTFRKWKLLAIDQKAVANTAYMPGLLNAAPGTYADVSRKKSKINVSKKK